MRKYWLIFLAILLVLATGIVACDDSGSLKGKSPEEMLSGAWELHKEASSQSGTYEIDLTIEADSSAGGEIDMLLGMLGGPIALSGDFAIQESPTAVAVTAGTDLLGMGLKVGARVIDGDAYLSVFGQWYEAPAESQDELIGVDTEALMEKIQQMLDNMETDPSTWCKDLKVVGDEKLGDTDVTHLTGSLDTQKMMDDVMEIMQSPEMAEIIAMTGSATDAADMGAGLEIPTAEELDEVVATLDQMLEEVTMDFWLSKAEGTIRQMEVNAHVVLPEEAGLEGISGVIAVVTVAFDKINQPVDIKAPADAKPIDQLPKDIEQNPILGGLLGGGLDLDF